MDKRLLDILVCPLCKGPLRLRRDPPGAPAVDAELVCSHDRLAYPIRDDIPVMLADEARRLDPADGA